MKDIELLELAEKLKTIDSRKNTDIPAYDILSLVLEVMMFRSFLISKPEVHLKFLLFVAEKGLMK